MLDLGGVQVGWWHDTELANNRSVDGNAFLADHPAEAHVHVHFEEFSSRSFWFSVVAAASKEGGTLFIGPACDSKCCEEDYLDGGVGCDHCLVLYLYRRVV